MGCNFQNTLFINRKSDDSFTITGCCLTEQRDISYEDFFEKDINLLGDLRKGLKQIKGTTCLHQPCDYQEIKNISINVLHRCNLKCYHCVSTFEKEYIKNSKKSLIDVLERLSKVKGLCKIELDCSGEVFLEYDTLVKMLKIFSKENVEHFSFVTNGTLLNKERIEELKEISEQTGIEYHFSVSVDGITKETYENTRVGGNFEKVIENICLLKDYFDTGIQFCIKKTNCKDAPHIKEFFKNLGFEVYINTDYFDKDMLKYIDESDLVYNQ